MDDIDENSCKILFKELVRCLGFLDYKITSCGNIGYSIVMISQDPSMAFKECTLMSQDYLRHFFQVQLFCSFSSLYKTLVNKLVDLEKNAGR